MKRRSARIIFTITTLLAYCLMFYLAPQMPRAMLGWGILFTLLLSAITGYVWFFSHEKNGNHHNGE